MFQSKTTSHRLHILYYFIPLLILMLFTQCKDKGNQGQVAGSNQDAFAGVIINHTSGEINAKDRLTILFKEEIVTGEMTGKGLQRELIKFTPSVSGKLLWETPSKLIFEPDKLEYDQQYQVELNIRKLLKGKTNEFEQDIFHFSFYTIPLDFDVYLEQFQVHKKESGKKNALFVDGVIEFNYLVDTFKVEKMLKVEYSGTKPEISWRHSNLQHAFTIGNIIKQKQETPMLINWDASVFKLDKKAEKRLLVPALNEFKVLSAGMKKDDQREIIISFTEQIDKNQDFNGLVYLENTDLRASYYVEGNLLHFIIKSDLAGEKTLKVETGILSADGKKSGYSFLKAMHFSVPKPQLRLTTSGTICPDVEKVIFPFEAINLNAVDVEISKVYQNNVMQFLQYSELDETYMSAEVSAIIWQGKIDLNSIKKSTRQEDWQSYGLDLMELISLETGAIYNVKIGFRKSYTDYPCEQQNDEAFEQAGIGELQASTDGRFRTIWRGWYFYRNRSWKDRDNPCLPLYYTDDNFIQQNIFASNIGLIAKYNEQNELFIAVCDLKLAKPLTGVELKVYSYQKQLIGEGRTNNEGLITLDVGAKAYFIVAQQGKEFAYLKLNKYSPLSMSEFEVGGKKLRSGIDGYIYGERSVWRPGDTMYLNFVLRDATDEIPEDHPVVFELYDPNGKRFYKTTTTQHTGPIYSFTCHTGVEDLTGNWRAVVSIGPKKFTKLIKIETIKPNRLKISMDFTEEEIQMGKSKIKLKVDWLTGIAGSGLNAKVDLFLKPIRTKFKQYKEYQFDDVARKIFTRKIILFNNRLDENGEVPIDLKLNKGYNYPGKMSAQFKVRAYEKSGEFSINSFSRTFSPYQTYVGVNFPKTVWGSTAIEINKAYKIPALVLDANGDPVPNRKLSVGIYETKWRWWWDDDGNELAQYNTDLHMNAFRRMEIQSDAQGQLSVPLEIEDYGSYMIRICDPESGHCTGQMFYAGYYGGSEEGNDFATKLFFKSDKSSYEKGEDVHLRIPAGKGSQVLITLETDGRILSREWVESKADVLDYHFKAEETMFPNVYVHTIAIQGLQNKISDLPARRYGVLNIDIRNKEKMLNPQMKVADVIKPNEIFDVEVSEKNKKAMAYTLAIVDEGLLDITRFKTPSLYDHFFAKRALLTRNWDNYDDLIANSANLFDKILSVGGDEEVEINNNADKANRFVPVVRHIGPFYLEGGKKAKHKIEMANYSGAVRVMLVAADNDAYGMAEKSIKVKQELMTLITAPRVLSPGEEIEIPATVFVMDDKLQDVEVSIETNGLFELTGDRSQLLRFNKPGDKIVFFKLKVKKTTGIGKIGITSKSRREISKQNVEIDIVNPNSYQKESAQFVLSAGEQRNLKIPLIGVSGTNTAFVEISKMPSIDLESKLRFLIHYPYGCVEQTTSAIFPQLYLGELQDLSSDRINRINLNIVAGIKSLNKFQLVSGAMSYWPGQSNENDWGSNYAAHLLLEAQSKGFNTSDLLPDLLHYITKKARSFRYKPDADKAYITVNQAYRTMILSKAGRPEFGAMNYLYNLDKLPYLSKWYLALAYSYAGKNEIARQLLKGKNEIQTYDFNPWSYGSYLRDYAVLLHAYDKVNMKQESAILLHKIIKIFNDRSWWSTQTTSWVLMALGANSGAENASMAFEYAYWSQKANIETDKTLFTLELSEADIRNKSVSISNNSKEDLFVSYVSQGRPLMQTASPETAKNLIMDVAYFDTSGKPINVDLLKMGTEFKLVATLRKSGLSGNLEEMVLHTVFPSGWEILNWRLDSGDQRNRYLDYQDIRDDRVYSFFDLTRNSMKIEIPLHATYPGKFYLPQIFAEAMYDNNVYATKSGKWVEVVR